MTILARNLKVPRMNQQTTDQKELVDVLGQLAVVGAQGPNPLQREMAPKQTA